MGHIVSWSFYKIKITVQSVSKPTIKEYIQRINDVIDFVEKNLDTDLSLEQLAQKAHYSSFHFHRIFSAVVGETVHEFVLRKRLERIAAILLVDKKRPLKELAYQYGFGSDNSFSRAFRKHYDFSPTRFKSEGREILSKIGIVRPTLEAYLHNIDNLLKWMAMNAQFTVKELPAIQLAGIAHIGDFQVMDKLYESLMKWGVQKGILDRAAFKAITIYHDNPNVTHPQQVRYSACVTVNKDFEAEGEIRPVTLQKGSYAVGYFEIAASDFPKAWESLCIWVVENGYAFRDGDYFEMYHNDHTTHPEQKFIVELCIPVANNGRAKKAQHEETTAAKVGQCATTVSGSSTPTDYHQLIRYMQSLRAYFQKGYGSMFQFGKVYQGSADYSYFSLTPAELKKQKLKFVIVFHHRSLQFSICLSGQNKQVRRQYWERFKGSDWDKYQLVPSIDDSLSIIDYAIVEQADLADEERLHVQIEAKSLPFIDEFRKLLEPFLDAS